MSVTVRHERGLQFPIDLGSRAFAEQKYARFYPRLLESAPVCPGRISLLKLQLVSRYEDCRFVLSDERFVDGLVTAVLNIVFPGRTAH